MDKKIAGLLGAAAALTAVNGAQASTPSAGLEPAATYWDLLNPIPNALALLLQTDEGQDNAAPATGDTRLAQHHHHHHHHMRHVIRRALHPRHHHHHHHHHHHND
jgi:hypothetical protein